ncbi:MAG: polysaccharide pyruvyl transferase family protein [Polyangiales bacterium]
MLQGAKKKAKLWRPAVDPRGATTHSSVHASSAVEVIRSDADADTTPAQGLRDWFSDVAKTAFDGLREHIDSDRWLQHATAAHIELAKSRYAVRDEVGWKQGEPLRLLLAGYNGTRNTGADVRVEEMIRQFRHLFGDDHVDLSVFTLDPKLTRGYFRTVKQLHLPKVFPKFLFDEIADQHGVIACEGSMFKSKFANALCSMMVGSLGIATAEQKIAVGYGGEAGEMDAPMKRFVAKHASDAYVICRNRASQDVLRELGIRSEFGTDTAWTFDPGPRDIGAKILREHGWNGTTPVMAICPINAFWWPVKPDVKRAMTLPFTDMHKEMHYGSVYFHADDRELQEKQDSYIKALASAVSRIETERDVFTVLIGSEQLDRRACEALNAELGNTRPVIVSDEHDMYEMVSVMRNASVMLSSRYHAIVMSMAAGVRSAGVTMDERIRNLMEERDQPDLCATVDDANLAERAYQMLNTLFDEPVRVKEGIDRCVMANLERFGRMGMLLVDHVKTFYPEFPFATDLGTDGDPWRHLPPMRGDVAELVNRMRPS